MSVNTATIVPATSPAAFSYTVAGAINANYNGTYDCATFTGRVQLNRTLKKLLVTYTPSGDVVQSVTQLLDAANVTDVGGF